MAYNRWIGLVWCMFGLSSAAMAQLDDVKEETDAQDAKYFAYGVTTNTHSGILGGFIVRSSTPVSRTKKGLPVHRYLALELVNIKHPKENALPTRLGTKFILGKVNYLFALRPEYGREWYFFRKSGGSSIGFSGILAAGPTIGIQKPYYIKYGRNGNEQPVLTVFDPEVHTDLNSILGSGSIWQGFFKNAKVIPGVHVKAAANIDMSTFGDSITGFELGATFEMYSKSPELISAKLSGNPKAYASAYLTLYFGNKKLIKK